MPHHAFNLEEVARYLHLAVPDVTDLVRRGEIPFSRRGQHAVFLRAEIDAWASRRILGLPARHLSSYHDDSSRATRALVEGDALVPALLKPGYIDLALASKTRPATIRALVALADRTGHVFDAAELLASVQGREEMCSTALPGGLALLHARHHASDRFDDSFLVLGRTVQAVPFGAPDGRPSRLFFLLCCQDDRLHLHSLARLCMMAARTGLIPELAAADSAESAHAAIVASEQAVLTGRKPAAEA